MVRLVLHPVYLRQFVGRLRQRRSDRRRMPVLDDCRSPPALPGFKLQIPSALPSQELITDSCPVRVVIHGIIPGKMDVVRGARVQPGMHDEQIADPEMRRRSPDGGNVGVGDRCAEMPPCLRPWPALPC